MLAPALALSLFTACDDPGEQRKDDTKNVDGKAPPASFIGSE